MNHEYQAILNSISDGVYITDGQGKTLHINRAFEQITGITWDQINNKDVRQLVNQGVYQKSVTLKVLESQKEESIVETLPNGKEVLLTGVPVYDKKGAITQVVTTLRDMEELTSLKHALARTVETNERYKMELLHFRLNQMNMENLIIHSQAMKQIMRTAMQLGDVDSTVLITGESGVGKEIVARVIHRSGRGEQAPMITTNCSAIPETLLESELFGYEKGAFTGADRGGKPGLFEVANGGTLFLDEIGDISLNTQVKLLRAIQEKEIVRVGGRKPIQVDVRVIAATNQDLEEMVRQGSFRQDLYYRLNVIPLHIPPLRERKEAILPLANHFLHQFNRRFHKHVHISPGVMNVFELYSWPGNVRELENTLERLVVLCSEDRVTPDQLPIHIIRSVEDLQQTPRVHEACPEIEEPTDSMQPLSVALARYEERILTQVWQRYPSTRKLAKVLGISQSTAVRKLSSYGIGFHE